MTDWIKARRGFARLSGCIALLAAAAARDAQGAGFSLYEGSARGNALGGAVVGRTGDASANFYNPANLTELPGTSALVGTTLLHPMMDLKIDGRDKENMGSGYYALPNLYLARQLSDMFYLGFGVYAEYGLGTAFDKDWALNADSQKTCLKVFTLNPNLACKVTDRLSLAAGLRAMSLEFENWRKPYSHTPLRPPYPIYGDMRTTLEGDSWGMGCNLALSYRITDDLDFGFLFRSRVRHTVKGHVNIESESRPVDGLLPDGRADARAVLQLPPSFTAGLNYRATEKWSIGTAATYTRWSTYDELEISFGPTRNAPMPTLDEEKNWRNVWRLALGTEYQLTERWTIAGGYVYDMDPICQRHTDTMLPAGSRNIVSAGTGYTVDGWTFYGSAGLIIVQPVKRTIDGHSVEFENGYCPVLSFSIAKSF